MRGNCAGLLTNQISIASVFVLWKFCIEDSLGKFTSLTVQNSIPNCLRKRCLTAKENHVRYVSNKTSETECPIFHYQLVHVKNTPALIQ